MHILFFKLYPLSRARACVKTLRSSGIGSKTKNRVTYYYTIHITLFSFRSNQASPVFDIISASATAVDETRVLIRGEGQRVEFIGCLEEWIRREKRWFSADGARRSESYYHGTIMYRTTVINRGMCHVHYRASNELILYKRHARQTPRLIRSCSSLHGKGIYLIIITLCNVFHLDYLGYVAARVAVTIFPLVAPVKLFSGAKV